MLSAEGRVLFIDNRQTNLLPNNRYGVFIILSLSDRFPNDHDTFTLFCYIFSCRFSIIYLRRMHLLEIILHVACFNYIERR